MTGEFKKAGILLFIFSILIFSIFNSIATESSVKITTDVPVSQVLPEFLLDKPLQYKNLIIYPVYPKKGVNDLDLMTLDEAVKKECLTISEIAGGEVNRVSIENTSKNWIFLLAGEIIVGAKQNRIIGKDTLIPPKSGKVEEQVFCVEHGRWVMQSDNFTSNNINCNMSVRQTAKQTNDQSLVWSEVAQSTTVSSKSNPTGKFDVLYEDEKINIKIEEYMKTFENLVKENKNMSGVVVIVGNEILGADIFGDRVLFEKLWAKLLKSYIIDALMNEKSDKSKLDKEDVIKFLNEAKHTEMKTDKTAVSGTRIDFSSKKVVGGIILDNSSNLIHYVQFPYKEIDYNNTPNTTYPQQQINAPVNIDNYEQQQIQQQEIK